MVCSAMSYTTIFTVHQSGPVGCTQNCPDYVSPFHSNGIYMHKEEALSFRHEDQHEQEHPLALLALASHLQPVNYVFDTIITKCTV